ncbi:hypothetical protein MJ1_0106 [Nanobdella aerobiophila]|uniref:Uncharacterized protein n=1 Tax=Nanobdella aerobiophila TaxID=2586965 RepID=A0A915WRW7_9ARCH|nr:hypothetical protein [Nanobdella aerobiophila]BBL45281.1 hypothetical protein MJ1_0106 [Nanobdella aerobiophila]
MVDNNKKFIFYYLIILLSFSFIKIWNKNYILFGINIFNIIFGIIYIPILLLLLKYTKTTYNNYKIIYLLFPLEIFSINTFHNFIAELFYLYIFFYLLAYFIGQSLIINNLKISKKQLIIYIFLLSYFIILLFINTVINVIGTDVDVILPQIVINIAYLFYKTDIAEYLFEFLILITLIPIFLYNYLNKNNGIDLSKLNKINNYKKIIIYATQIIIFIQLIYSIILSLFYIKHPNINDPYYKYISLSMIFISIYEYIIFYLIYKKLKNKFVSFYSIILLFLYNLQIFFGVLYLFYDSYLMYLLHTRIIISFIFFFLGIHYFFNRKNTNILKKSIGITLGILLIFQLVSGELLENEIFGIAPGMNSFLLPIFSLPNLALSLGVIHGVIVTLSILTLIYLHTKI